MTREILFKAKTEDANEWVYGSLLEENHLGHIKYGISFYDRVNGCNKVVLIKEETICQYTGLEDKVKVKIFEFDKLSDKDKNISIVVWIKEWAMFGCMFYDEYELYRMNGIKELDEDMFWTFPIDNTQYRVIGNIHD